MTTDLFEPSAAQVPAKATSGNVKHENAEVDGRAQPVKEAGPLVTGRECGTRSDAVCDKRGVRNAAYDPASALGTCGTCGHGSPGRFNMIACDQVTWPVSVNNPSLPCPIGRWIELTPEILAKRAAQAGIDQAVAAADRAIAGWSNIGSEFLREFAEKNRGRQYIGHEIVEASKAAKVVQPPNDKAWGAVIQRAARVGIIKRVGYAEDPNRHGNPVPLWETA